MTLSISNSYSNYSTDTTSGTDRASQLLKRMDTDQDGKVSEGEFENFGALMNAQGLMGPPPSQLVSGASSATSGVSATGSSTSSSGASTTAPNAFAAVDTNGDASLSLDELTSMITQADSRISRAQSAEGQPPPPPPPPSTTAAAATTTDGSSTASITSSSNDRETLSSLFSKADTNGDNVLSVNEFSDLLAEFQTNLKTQST